MISLIRRDISVSVEPSFVLLWQKCVNTVSLRLCLEYCQSCQSCQFDQLVNL